ncbi:hypothetical protein [Zhongshania sp.]|jgi:hypothetical protein|uniref:hypothetical protein n=1 Tax=Zhongshania sp. TaxID=1971902 RepID=UPI0039E2BB0C
MPWYHSRPYRRALHFWLLLLIAPSDAALCDELSSLDRRSSQALYQGWSVLATDLARGVGPFATLRLALVPELSDSYGVRPADRLQTLAGCMTSRIVVTEAEAIQMFLDGCVAVPNSPQ